MKTQMKQLTKSVALFASIGLLGAGIAAPVWAVSKLPPATTVNGITTQNGSASDAFPGLKNFLNLPAADRTQVDVFYILRIKHCDADQVRITLYDKGRAIPLRIADDGRVTPLPTRDQLNSGATLSTVLPASCTVGPKVKVTSTQPAARTYDAAGLALGIKQGNVAMGKIAGPASLLLTKLDRIYFVGGGSGTVEVNGQQKALPRTGATDEYPAGTPYFVPSSAPGATRITLSATPSIALFDNPPK